MADIQTLNPPLSSKAVHQFPLPTWLENLAVRSNGQILATNTTLPELWLIDPATTPPKATLVHKFPKLAMMGIVEVSNDLFVVGAGDFDASKLKNEPGSFAVWSVDMSEFEQTSSAAVKKVADFPGSGLLNGMELLSAERKEVLIADSEIGGIWKLDVVSGKHELILQNDETRAPAQGLHIGANGVKIFDGHLYWTNSGKSLFCRTRIDDNGKPSGDVQVLVDGGITGDDFVIDAHGNAWIMQPAHNTVTVVKANGEKVLVVGRQDSLEISGPTACHFGKKAGEEHILYISTNGSLITPVDGKVEGGKIVALDTRRFYE